MLVGSRFADVKAVNNHINHTCRHSKPITNAAITRFYQVAQNESAWRAQTCSTDT